MQDLRLERRVVGRDVNAAGRRTKMLRTGPKVAYCLRDLERTRPGLARSPGSAHYPACSNNSQAQHVTVGTSVGWADIYPPTYPEQWIKGCRGVDRGRTYGTNPYEGY